MKNQDSNDMAARGSRLPTPICSGIIRFADEQPPNDYDYRCVIVLNDGFEAPSDGGSVHDTCVKSRIAYGWRRYLPNAKADPRRPDQ